MTDIHEVGRNNIRIGWRVNRLTKISWNVWPNEFIFNSPFLVHIASIGVARLGCYKKKKKSNSEYGIIRKLIALFHGQISALFQKNFKSFYFIK